MRKYPEEQVLWLREHGANDEWENMEALTSAFNFKFGTNKSVCAISSIMNKKGIIINSACNNNRYTPEQEQWIVENVAAIEWRNEKHFVDTFNALFGTQKAITAMRSHLCNLHLALRSKHNTDHYTPEMKEWLRDNYEAYSGDFARMAKDFNEKFGTDFSNCRLTKWLVRHGIHTPGAKSGRPENFARHSRSGARGRNKGSFAPGHTRTPELPVGTIRYNSDGRPFIKVKMCGGESGGNREHGHNYREPWWKPLQKKIWEDHYGPVPDGYVVCTMSNDPSDTDINHIGIIDRRGTARMAKNDWWGIENVPAKKTAVRWCNLYYTAKDNGITVKEN